MHEAAVLMLLYNEGKAVAAIAIYQRINTKKITKISANTDQEKQ